ncbi:hypothetical protein TNCV_4901431 [Trichonephila clavipes]|nr:hypothetical protein TNCV_4901431 [Trichonephila clavipes]
MSSKEREIKPNKRKTKKLKSSGRNANKTIDSHENQAFAKDKNDFLRQIDFLNSIILDTKLKEPNKSKAHFVKTRKHLHIYKKDEPVAIKRTQFNQRLKLRPKFHGLYRIKTIKPHDRNEVEKVYLEHFGIPFDLVCSFSGWPIVNWMAQRAIASSSSIPSQVASKENERPTTPVETAARGEILEHERRGWERKRDRRTSAEQ